MDGIAVEQFMVCDSVDEVGGEIRGHAIRLRTDPGEIRENVIALVRVRGGFAERVFSFVVYHEEVAGEPKLLGTGPAVRVRSSPDETSVFVLHAGPVRMPGPGRYVFVLFGGDRKLAEREYVFGP